MSTDQNDIAGAPSVDVFSLEEGKMTQRDRLMAALFGNPDREHIDIKFFTNAAVDVSDETFCEQAADMVDQLDAGVGADDTFHEDFASVRAADLVVAD